MASKERQVKSVKVYVRPATPELLALNRMHTHMGHFFRPGQVVKAADSAVFPIQGELPLRIRDDEKGVTRTGWLAFPELGRVSVKKSGKVAAPSVTSVFRTARQHYRDITDSIEADLIYAGQTQFGSLTYSKYLLQPLAKIVGLLDEGITTGLPLNRLAEATGDSSVAEKHAQYLIDSEYASIVHGKPDMLVPTQKFVLARRQYTEPTRFISSMVGTVLALQYDKVTEHIPMIKAYVRAGMAFYRPAAEYGELLSMKYETLVDNYKRMYEPSQKILDSFRQIYLRDLYSHNILHLEDNLVTGDSEIFPAFLERAAPKIAVARQEQLPA